MTLAINARFLTQPLSGVQRFARELLGALDRRLDDDPALRAQLGPVVAFHPDRTIADPGWTRITLQPLRPFAGHAWEQGPLWRASRGAVLLSLGNSGPLLHPRHVLALHDANIWDEAEAFSPRYRRLHRTLRPRLAQRAAALITVSRYSARRLAPHLGVPAQAFRIVGNAAWHIAACPADSGTLAAAGLTPGGYLFAVGNDSPNKNIAALAAAHGRAGPDLPPLVVAGGRAPGLAGIGIAADARIRHVGRVSDQALRALYEGAAGFVFPSLNEGFGIPPLEAMALGTPVAAARRGAMPEVLGDAALWFDPEDADATARTLRALAGLDGAARQDRIARGRAQAARYTWDRSAAALIGVLDAATADAATARGRTPSPARCAGSATGPETG